MPADVLELGRLDLCHFGFRSPCQHKHTSGIKFIEVDSPVQGV